MKQKIQLITYLVSCGILIAGSLYAGRDAYKDCDKCHIVVNHKKDSTNILTGLYESYPSGVKP